MLLKEKEQQFLFCVDEGRDDEAVQITKQSAFGTQMSCDVSIDCKAKSTKIDDTCGRI